MIVVKIDAVNMAPKSVNVDLSIFLYILRPVGLHDSIGISTKMILSYCEVSCGLARQKPYVTTLSSLLSPLHVFSRK